MQPKTSYMKHTLSRSRYSSMLVGKIAQSILALSVSFCAFLFMASGGQMSQIVNVLNSQQFPYEIVLLEGLPGLSQPKHDQLMQARTQTLSLGLFLLTGVNVADQRTYFLHYLSPPKEGPAWLGWAYSPRDPEMEGAPQDAASESSDSATSPAFAPKPAPDYPLASGAVLVGLYNTHTSESYIGGGGKERAEKGTSGDVAVFSKSLASNLNARNIPTVYDPSINDTNFPQAYTSSYWSAKGLLDTYPDMRLLLDIHRDGLPQAVGKRTVKIDGKDTARILIIVGQKHVNWKANDELAQRLIRVGEAKYPGLFFSKVHYAADARYNQHLFSGALLLEIGSQLNTPEESMNAAGPLAEVLKECLQ
ncbi:MAG: stage II sporulation protein P [Peptococcaceae bacterium]|nr:stage II sporulation protein P [Peptococcaceae bacterium]